MLRRPELPLVSELPAFDDDPALFDPSPEWFVPGVKASLLEDEGEDDVAELGFRSLIEQPEVLSKAWWSSGREASVGRVLRGRRRSRGRPPGPPAAA